MYKWFRLRTASRIRAFYRILLFLFTIPVYRAVTLVNRTIDSSFGDPVTGFVPIYQPQQDRMMQWYTQNQIVEICTSSCLRLDKAKAFNGTWDWAESGSGESVNVTLRFTGVAVWVFFILPDFKSHDSDNQFQTIANITLDGQYAGTFSHYPENTTDLIYNATIFHTSGLVYTSHELVIGTTEDYLPVVPEYMNSLIFDWAIYTVLDSETSPLPNPSSPIIVDPTPSTTSVGFPSTTSVAFPSTISSSSTASMTPTSSSKIGVVVGCTLGGLAVITLALVFLVRRLRRAPPVKAEGVLDIDVPPHHQPYRKHEIPVSVHEPTQSKTARLQEARQRELDERILSTQHELDNLGSLRNASSADEASDPSALGPSQFSPELALLRNEMQQLRDRMDYLQAQRESDWAQGLSNEPPPPAYAQLPNDVR
ncbi:hypothetical protein M378DRAFT_160189 [Amanita muscaria Koide BX008]|uniref:Uncharacterized protein n=1 Tax=Amanita muscaria (strain Koide BX008) TaxID=946122 RepID=A0A0C2XED8_AMAMK|nr:hypothetical protein M378DRAFT_160189 [Amanita muscaria Koide BX008]